MTVSLLRVRIYTQITVLLETFLFENFTKSLVILKREALKAFQCASTVKAVMENTGKAAGDGLLPCFALKSRFAQHDIKNENGNAVMK